MAMQDVRKQETEEKTHVTVAAARLRALHERMTPLGDLGWWFDGRDIFHKQPGTNLDQVIVPFGHVLTDTFTPEGRINVEDVRGFAALRNALPELIAAVEAAEMVLDHTDDFDFSPASTRAMLRDPLAALAAALTEGDA